MVVSCYIDTIIDWIDIYFVLENGATFKWFIASLCSTILLDEVISSDARFVYRFCTCCDKPYSDFYGKSPLFLSPDICRMVGPKRILSLINDIIWIPPHTFIHPIRYISIIRLTHKKTTPLHVSQRQVVLSTSYSALSDIKWSDACNKYLIWW